MAKILFALSVIFLHFVIVRIGDFPLTLGAVLGTVAVLRVALRGVVGTAVGVTSVWVIYSCIVYFLNPDLVTQEDFVQTLLLSSAAVFIGVSSVVGAGKTQHYSGTARLLLWGLSILGVIQYISASMNNPLLYNLWGDRQAFYEYEVRLGADARATGLYLEPAFFALVLGVLMCIAIADGASFKSYLLPALAGMLSTQSASGLGTTLVLLAVVTFSKQGTGLGSSKRLAWTLLGGFLFAFVSWDYLGRRIASADTPGSSAYYRLVGPQEVLRWILLENPLGAPLGSIQKVVGSFQIVMAGVVGTSLDNGLYVVVYYMGWIGLVSLLWLGWLSARPLLERAPIEDFIRPLALLLFLLFTGSVFTLEFAVLVGFLFMQRNRADSQARAVRDTDTNG